MIKVCFIGSEYAIVKRLAPYLKTSDIQFVLMAKTKADFRLYKKEGFETYPTWEVFEKEKTFSEQELLDLDLKYGPYGIKAICNSDIFMPYLYKKREDQIQLIARAYKFWENFFNNHKIDFVMIIAHSGLFDARTAYNVSRARGNPIFLRFTFSPRLKDYFALCDVGEEHYWSELNDVLTEGPKLLSEEQRKFTLAFIDKRLGDSNQNVKINFTSASLFNRFKYLTWLWKEVILARFKNEPFEAAAQRCAIHKLIKRSWWNYITKNFMRYDKVENERYVYFPIYSENEIMNLALYHYWTQNQLSLIEEVAASLPSGIKLYVKEHPNTPGQFPLLRLKEVQKIPNVKIIHPSIKVKEILDNCEALINLHGTTGWEAFLARKPVVMLAPWIYSAKSRLIYRVDSPCELPVTIFKAIKEGSSVYNNNENEWLWFIHSVITTCAKGEYPGGTCLPFDCDGEEENVMQVAKSISEKIYRKLISKKND